MCESFIRTALAIMRTMSSVAWTRNNETKMSLAVAARTRTWTFVYELVFKPV